MPRNGKKNLTSDERVSIVVAKEATSKTVTQIAKDIGRAPSTVSQLSYGRLSPEEQLMVQDLIGEISDRSGLAVVEGIEAMRKTISVAATAPDAKNLPGLSNATRALHEVHRLSSNRATEIHEHRTPLDYAKAALLKAMASGMFQPEQKGEVIEYIAKQYNLEPKQLEG